MSATGGDTGGSSVQVVTLAPDPSKPHAFYYVLLSLVSAQALGLLLYAWAPLSA